jgi:Protein kinase domain
VSFVYEENNMPVGITARATANTPLLNIETMGEAAAMDAMHQIKGHLSLPGKARGVLTLHYRTQPGEELQLRRKNGFQLLGRGMGNQRLNDTRTAIDTLLRRAGLTDAADQLANHLASKPANQGNRVSSRQLLSLLNQHLPARSVEHLHTEVENDPLAIPSAPGNRPESSALGPAQGKILHPAYGTVMEDSLFEGGAEAEGRLLGYGLAVEDRLIELDQPSVGQASIRNPQDLNELLRHENIVKGDKLGEGSYGVVHQATLNGHPVVLKTFTSSDGEFIPSSRVHAAYGSEAIAAYLTSNKDDTYASRVHVAQPEYFLVSTGGRFQKVDPQQLRALIKNSPQNSVQCHGLIMPQARGEEVYKLMNGNQLSQQQKRDLIRETIQSLKTLNERGFVHRDIKPENMYFDKKTNTATLIDTGMLYKVSKNNPASHFITARGGTPNYMHPRAHTKAPHGTEADLYSVAVMALKLDQPLAHKYLEEVAKTYQINFKNKQVVKEGYLTTNYLNDRIDRDIRMAHTHGKRDELSGLKNAINDPHSLAGFAMQCFELANRSAESWAIRGIAQGRYQKLLDERIFS